MRKFLYSPGYGAGWSTWNSDPVAKFMTFYEPIIEHIESGGKFEVPISFGNKKKEELHPLLEQLQRDCKEKFNEDYVCILGADQLRVGQCEDDDQIQITEYDGSERYQLRSSDHGWY